jgi:exopolyphosphatase/pppGpp-phosphohydrolase
LALGFIKKSRKAGFNPPQIRLFYLANRKKEKKREKSYYQLKKKRRTQYLNEFP